MTARLNGQTLPEGWVWSTIGIVTDVIMGQSPPGDTYNQDGSGIALINGPVEFGPTPFSKTLQTKFTTQPTKLCEQGDLILCVRGSTTGRMNIAGFQACIGRGVAAIRAKADQAYINIFVHSMQHEIYEMGTGSTFPNISSDNIKSIKIPIAPLNEQHRIVAAIETQFTRLDAAVTALERSQANLKRYRAAVLKAACEGRLVPTEAELAQAEGRIYEPASVLLERILAERRRKWETENPKKKYQEPVAPDTSGLPELPEGWCWATVEQLGKLGEQTVLTGPFGSNLGREDFTTTGTPVLTIGCLTEQGLNSDKFAFISNAKAQELNRYRVREGDLLFSRMATVGRAGLVTRQFENAIFNYHLMRLRLADNAIRFDYFISYVRGSHNVTNYVKEVNHGATRDGINTEQLLALPVAVPPMAEQSRIVTEIERLLSIINQLGKTIETDLARANRLRQSILKRAFAGQLVPQDPNDEPAAVLLERIQRTCA